jgi:hypothetical protein
MIHIPVEKVAGNVKAITLTKEPDMRKMLADLCKDLDVDAVAILEFDMAFKKLLSGLDFIGGLPAIPSISSTLVLVNRDGEVAINSGSITRGKGKRFEGKSVGMLEQSHVRLNNKSIDSYRLAIDKSADSIKQRMEKDFSKVR